MILLDTDVCLGLLGGNSKLLEVYADYPDEICVPFVSVQELYGAASRSSNPIENAAIIETFLLGVTVLFPTHEVLRHCADVQLAAQKAHKNASYIDVMIYSLSKVLGAKLVTTQVKRYCFT